MKKRNLNQKLRIQKSKIASVTQMNAIIGGENSVAPDACDFIKTMNCTNNCPSNTCPPGTNGCNTANCPPNTAACPTGNSICQCDSFITDPGVSGC